MTPEEQKMADAAAFTEFVISHDHAGMKTWLRSMPADQIRRIREQYGDDNRHQFHALIEERYRTLLAEEATKQPVKEAERWYKQPVGIVVIGVFTFFVGRGLYALVTHHFPRWFH